MGKETHKWFKNYLTKLAYFFYWKLQNSPGYVEFYNKVGARPGEDLRTLTFRGPLSREDHLKRFEAKERILGWAAYAEENFKCTPFSMVSPFKEVDWSRLPTLEKPDPDILTAFNFSKFFRPAWPSATRFSTPTRQDLRKELLGPIARIDIDLTYDKKEILSFLSMVIDRERDERGIHPRTRHHLDKFHLYAAVWDWRKKKIPFSKMPGNEPTNKGRYRKACELLGYRHAAPKGGNKICNTCGQRPSCREACPDLLFHLQKVEMKREEKVTSQFALIADNYAYKDWFYRESKSY